MVHVVSYDLNQPGQNYPKLYEKIESLGSSAWHCLDSTWMIDTQLSAADVRDAVKSAVDESDDVVVVKAGNAWATSGLSDNCNAWLREHVTGKAKARV